MRFINVIIKTKHDPTEHIGQELKLRIVVDDDFDELSNPAELQKMIVGKLTYDFEGG
jgi:hypothetical protein